MSDGTLAVDPQDSPIDLMTTVEAGGCSAKLSATDLEALMSQLPRFAHPDLLVGTETGDDAAAWRLDSERALIFTTDFFPPLCSDPWTFGQIAATNALSDVYAMGGKPLLALNIFGFSRAKLPASAYAEILRGGAEKVLEAGALLVGGHTIDDHPPKYGLAVVGLAHPDRLLTNAGARPGDQLILTKPLGTGILTAARKLGIGDDAGYEQALRQMRTLNAFASEVALRHGVRAATDITGFGLAGHAMKIARASLVDLHLPLSALPLLPGVEQLADDGCLPGAALRNLEYAQESLRGEAFTARKMVACDPQTSGGLLLCVPEPEVEAVLAELRTNLATAESVWIGEVSAPREAVGCLWLE